MKRPAEPVTAARDGGLHCPACNRRLGSWDDVKIEVSRVVGPDEFSKVVCIGARVVLEPGFVNRKRLHPEVAYPWYGLGNRRRAGPGLRVGPIAFISCPCGQDVVIGTTDGTEKANAVGDADRRGEILENEVLIEARDREVEQQTDFALEEKAGAVRVDD